MWISVWSQRDKIHGTEAHSVGISCTQRSHPKQQIGIFLKFFPREGTGGKGRIAYANTNFPKALWGLQKIIE